MILWPLLSFCAVWGPLSPFARAALEPVAEEPAGALLPAVVSDILLHHFRHPFQPVQVYRSSGAAALLDVVGPVVRALRGQCTVSLGPAPDEGAPRTRSVLFLEAPGALWRTLAEFGAGRNDHSGRYLLVVTGSNASSLRPVFEELWRRSIVDVNVLVREADATVLVYSYRPYSPSHCGSPAVELVARLGRAPAWAGRRAGLYPRRRITGFHNCLLQVGTFEVKPYTILDRTADGGVEVGGFEGELVRLLARRLQFRVNVTVPPHGGEWGVVGPRGNRSGTMRLLQDGQVDFIVACMAMDATRNRYLRPGISHYTSRVLFAVPPGRPYTAFEKLFRPFARSTWLAVGACLGAGAAVIAFLGLARVPAWVRVLAYGPGVRTPLLNALYLLFGGSVQPVPARGFPRALLALWLLFTFVLRTVYQGSLYLYLQRSATYPPLATLDEVARSPFEYHMVSIAMRFFVDRPEVGRRARFIPPGLDSLGRMVAGMADRYDDRVVICPTDVVAYHNRGRKRSLGGKPIHVTRDSITTFPLTIYYQPQSLLTAVFDREVRKVTESGLIDFWVRNYGDYDFQVRAPAAGGDPKRLTNSHLAGAYQLFGVALLLSALVFAVELVSVRVRCPCLRNLLDFCIH